ncbi:unnamed protein product [Blepharisma stoltei]|uniref:Uncharacterized protein n=1 Tax=Blepharisma stoltei TaxID=1481888 RepID=A0AAU9IXD6_9CILI|nr:unnamed protein product [Blepharisma stoltei]
MESKTTYENLLLEIAKQEETIDGYFREAEEQGSIDPNFEEYLNQAKLELHKKREELLKRQEMTNSIRSQSLKISKEDAEPEENSPKIKRARTVEFEEKVNPKNKYPFYSIKNIELRKPNQRSSSTLIENSQNSKPIQIFKKISRTRSNNTSPSERRYEDSPKEVLSEYIVDDVYTPVIQKRKIPIIKVDKSVEIEENIPDLMLKRAISDISNISSFLNDKDIGDKLETLQWYRELKNSAHEKMLDLKEQILMEKEKKLQTLIEYLPGAAKNNNECLPEVAKNNNEYLKAKSKANLPPLSPKRNEEVLTKAKTSPHPRSKQVTFQLVSHNKTRSAGSSPDNSSNYNPNCKEMISKNSQNTKSQSFIPLNKEDKFAELVNALPGIPSEIASKLVKDIKITHI